MTMGAEAAKLACERAGTTPEDIDFIIGYQEGDETHLILIEAKASTSWSNVQLESKAHRLVEIFGADGKRWKSVVPHFLITSPIESKDIETKAWPEWMKFKGGPAWVELKMPEDIQSVTRCDANGNVTSKGDHWTILPRKCGKSKGSHP